MKHGLLITAAISVLFAAPIFAENISRAEILQPDIDRLWKNFETLPKDYQSEHRDILANYLKLFTTTNDIAWNDAWMPFVKSMGEEFQSSMAYSIEVMKIAEAHVAGYPQPEVKIPAIADHIFSQVPTNAILFIHEDVLESMLSIEQYRSNKRLDVALIDPGRLPEDGYMSYLKTKYPDVIKFDIKKRATTIMKEAIAEKEKGNPEFFSLAVVGERVTVPNVDAVLSIALLHMKSIAADNNDRPSVLLPSTENMGRPMVAYMKNITVTDLSLIHI